MTEERQDSHTVDQELVEPIEEPVEHEVMEDTPQDELIGDLLARNYELEERVSHLEEQNLTHQFMEQQYRDTAYQAQGELVELRRRLEQAELQLRVVKVENQALKFEFDLEIADKIRIEDAWVDAARKVDQLMKELEARDVRIESLGRALDSAYMSPKVGDRRQHREIGESSRSVRRRVIDDQMHVHAEVTQQAMQ